MKYVYISGAITGTKDYVERFRNASLMIFNRNEIPINPVSICGHLTPHSTWETYMRVCIKALCDCSHVYMLKGWEKSKGATEEHRIAVMLNLDIEYEED